jgi:GT2 family glycosyltransferase
MYDVSIIIVNWNTRDILRECLISIYKETLDISYEIIVIDNFSSDGSALMIKKEFPEAILIANEENRGFAVANNQGMEIANGRYVLLLNSDTVVLENAIQKTVRFADNHPEAAVLGCKAYNADMSLQPTCFMYPSLLNLFLLSTYLYKLFPRNRFFGREFMSWWDRGDVREVEVVTGCFMLVRKTAIEQVGMMDNSYFMYAEETDWCYRFGRAGWKKIFYPEAVIIHYGGMSSSKNPVEMSREFQKSFLLFMENSGGLFSRYTARFIFCISGFIRLIYWCSRWVFSCEERRNICISKIRQSIITLWG